MKQYLNCPVCGLKYNVSRLRNPAKDLCALIVITAAGRNF